jgi:hypothetical protein
MNYLKENKMKDLIIGVIVCMLISFIFSGIIVYGVVEEQKRIEAQNV